MAGDGTPDEATKRLGEEIAKLRTKRGFSRSLLTTRVLFRLGETHPLIAKVNDGVITRLETGRTVNVPFEVIDIVLSALECTPKERATVLMAGNLNPLSDSNGNTSPEAQLMGKIMAQVYENADVREALKEVREQTIAPEQDRMVDAITQDIVKLIRSNLSREYSKN